LVIKFFPKLSTTWIGNFQRGLTGFDTVIVRPNGPDIVAVAGGLGYVVRPEAKQAVESFGGMIDSVIEIPELRLLEFGCVSDFECYGENGKQ
jgi:hypothetical protein